ncbi:M23 family metallopeptidase [bacterium]|nr:M23 family metallopeptidase [bacterium]
MSSPLTLQFVFGKRTATITIPPFVLLLMVIAVGTGYGLARLNFGQRVKLQAQEIATLREHNQWLEHDLYEKRAELVRVAALADSRSQELWTELEVRHAELTLLWKQLGREQRRPAVRRPALAARSGRPVRYGLLQRQFGQLQVQLAATITESERLQQVARAHQQAQRAAERARRARAIPAGPPCSGEMTSPYGLRTHPIYGTGRLHSGCDFTTDYGTEIRATGEGTVVTSDWLGGYGQVVEIDHGDGLRTLYAHCSQLKVTKGQRVQRGQPIATVGSTGLASGPHCHYEVHFQGKAVDPKSYLPKLEARPNKPKPKATWLQPLLDVWAEF